MTYELKGGEEICDGILYGWTGLDCVDCNGTGDAAAQYALPVTSCLSCGGAGGAWGRMPIQPKDLPA